MARAPPCGHVQSADDRQRAFATQGNLQMPRRPPQATHVRTATFLLSRRCARLRREAVRGQRFRLPHAPLPRPTSLAAARYHIQSAPSVRVQQRISSPRPRDKRPSRCPTLRTLVLQTATDYLLRHSPLQARVARALCPHLLRRECNTYGTSAPVLRNTDVGRYVSLALLCSLISEFIVLTL